MRLNEYKNRLSVYDYQYYYWQIVQCYICLNNVEEAEKYYLKAKKLFVKVGKGSKDATEKFIFTSKLFYEYAYPLNGDYKKHIPEMEWFINQEVAIEDEAKEHGLISFYLGICYKEISKKEEAIKAFQVAMNYLQDTNWDFYESKYKLATNYIIKLGGKIPKKKSLFKKVLKGIFNV